MLLIPIVLFLISTFCCTLMFLLYKSQMSAGVNLVWLCCGPVHGGRSVVTHCQHCVSGGGRGSEGSGGGTFEKECMESGVGFCTCATVNARGLDPNSSLRCCTDMCCYTYTRFTKWKSGWIIWEHGKYILMYSIWKHLLCCAGNIKIQVFQLHMFGQMYLHHPGSLIS